MALVPVIVHSVISAFAYCVPVLVPMLFFWRRYRSRNPFIAAWLTVVLVVIDELALMVPSDVFGLRWNWIGKTLESSWPLLALLILRLPRSSSGLRLPESAGAYMLALAVAAGLCCFHILYFVQGQFAPHDKTDLESILFQLTMPGLGEEVFYRGLLLGALDRRLGRQWQVLDVKIGAGCLISSGIFVVAHIVDIGPAYKISVCPDPFFYFFVSAVSLSMCYLRYKTGSVLPCILAHNIVNGFRYVASAVIAGQ